jgi:hypothetical protein
MERKKHTTFFTHSPTTCPSKHTKRIANKTLLVFYGHFFQNYLFSQKNGVAHGMYLPAAVKGLMQVCIHYGGEHAIFTSDEGNFRGLVFVDFQ